MNVCEINYIFNNIYILYFFKFTHLIIYLFKYIMYIMVNSKKIMGVNICI